jgi:hypothetical protein
VEGRCDADGSALDFARTSPGVGPLGNGYYIVFGGTQNGFATSGVTQYDPNGVE